MDCNSTSKEKFPTLDSVTVTRTVCSVDQLEHVVSFFFV